MRSGCQHGGGRCCARAARARDRRAAGRVRGSPRGVAARLAPSHPTGLSSQAERGIGAGCSIGPLVRCSVPTKPRTVAEEVDALLARMISDVAFRESLEWAPDDAHRRKLIREAGFSSDFTLRDVQDRTLDLLYSLPTDCSPRTVRTVTRQPPWLTSPKGPGKTCRGRGSSRGFSAPSSAGWYRRRLREAQDGPHHQCGPPS